MPERRKHYDKRQILDYNYIQTLLGESIWICLPKSVLYIAHKLVSERGLWKTSYAIDTFDDYYLIPNDAEFLSIRREIAEFIDNYNGVDQMNCDITSALQALAQASGACCPGGGGGGGSILDIGGEPYFGTEQPLSEQTSFPSENFETESEYLGHKCDVANAIVDGLIASLNNFSLLSLASIISGSAIISIAAIAGLLTVPPLAFFVALIITGVAFGLFHTLSNAIADAREEIVCLLYNSETATAAYDALEDWVNDWAISVGVLEIGIEPIKNIIMSTAPIDTMNKLFTAFGLPEGFVPDIDCSVCETCPDVWVVTGFDNGDGTYTATQPNPPSGSWDCYLNFGTDHSVLDCSNCGPEFSVTINSITGWTEIQSGLASFRVYSDADCPTPTADLYASDTMMTLPATYCCRSIRVFSDTEFTMSITVNGEC